MLFNSYSFLFLFAPLFFPLYWAVRNPWARKALLVGASYLFYGVWSPKFALLMFGTTAVDYFTAQKVADSPTNAGRRFWLALSMVVNLGVLGIFKYYNFFADSLNLVAARPLLPIFNIILPIGISFYTFESMSYTIDVYRKKVVALRRFLDYAHFVTMFPRLVAGPIVRYHDLEEQLRSVPKSLPLERVLYAVHMFTLGLAKKVLIADPIAVRLVDPLFASGAQLDVITAWVAALGYSAQLYLDFSGYSDMAVGLGALLGFQLPRNFNLPYLAVNVGEFWRRWHISLSTWLRDYLYIPLGGNRGGQLAVARNLFLTMAIGGLWHGANWTFLLWGALHGVALAAYNTGLLRAPWLPRKLSIAFTFLFVVVGWVLFRAPSVAAASTVYLSMVGLHGAPNWAFLRVETGMVMFLAAALGICFTIDTYDVRPPTRAIGGVALALLLLVCLTRLAMPSPFLYFQF